MAWKTFLIYLLVMAGVTYLIRMIPLAAIRGKVKSVFLQSFLYYVPYLYCTCTLLYHAFPLLWDLIQPFFRQVRPMR